MSANQLHRFLSRQLADVPRVSHRKIPLHAFPSGGAISMNAQAMVRGRVFRLIAILLTMWALGVSAAEARTPRPPRPPRERHCRPGRACRHGTGFCNDAGRCCDTADGDFACGSNCCEPGQACCGGSACVDVQHDNNNCGGCGIVCSGGQSCQNGVCTCPGDLDDCGGQCVNTQSDNNNCGGCGNHC